MTGGAGQLGVALARHPWPAPWRAVALTRADLDMADPAAIAAKVAAHPWAAVINAAAYTAVDKAESEPLTAWNINALAPAALAVACRAADIPLIHVSTDYVFDGSKSAPWEIDDPAGPLGVYGASKFGGELAVRTSHRRHAIIRTSWLMSIDGSNFVKTMLRFGAEGRRLRVVTDQRGNPTSAADLADALAQVAIRLVNDRQAPMGTFHFTNVGPVSRYDFTRAISEGAHARGLTWPGVEAISTADLATPAKRPANSTLSTARIEREYGITPRPWTVALDEILDQLIGPRK